MFLKVSGYTKVLVQVFQKQLPHIAQNYSSTSVANSCCTFDTIEDRYNGVTVDLKDVNVNSIKDDQFSQQLTDCLKKWREETRTVVWLKVPLTHSRLIPVAGAHGFQYHHAEGTEAMLKLWLKTSREDTTPQFATHQIGVSGFVLNEKTKEVLVVQDKNRPHTLWKFPGGLSDLGEDIGETAVREVYEETGIKSEFKSILAFRQQHLQPGAFGRSDIYIICRLHPLTFTINACSEEIRLCKWMPLKELRKEIEVSSITTRLTDLVEFGLTHGFDKIDIGCSEMKSVYKGLKFKLFHRPFSISE